MKPKIVLWLALVLNSGCCIVTMFLWWIGQMVSAGFDCHLNDKIFCEIDCGGGRIELSLTRSYGEPFAVRCSGFFNNFEAPKFIDFMPRTRFYSNVIVGRPPIFQAFRLDHEPAAVAVENQCASIDIPYWFLVLLFAALPALMIIFQYGEKSKRTIP